MILSSLALFLCFFGTFGSERLSIGKYPRILDYKKVDPSLKIINGNKTSIAKYPFIASLQIQQTQFGSSLILSKRWLLTTGFNVIWEDIKNIQFRVGSNSYSSKGQVLNASQVIIHPNYTGYGWDYDIAVVKTDKPIRFNKRVKAITLGSNDLEGGTKAFVAGWGMKHTMMGNLEYTPSPVLLEGLVTVYSWNNCAKVYKSDLTARLMCTFDKTVGPCVYDYGDPLVVNNTLYGLYAGGYDCTLGQSPVLYTDIPSLAPWVKSVISYEEE